MKKDQPDTVTDPTPTDTPAPSRVDIPHGNPGDLEDSYDPRFLFPFIQRGFLATTQGMQPCIIVEDEALAKLFACQPGSVSFDGRKFQPGQSRTTPIPVRLLGWRRRGAPKSRDNATRVTHCQVLCYPDAPGYDGLPFTITGKSLYGMDLTKWMSDVDTRHAQYAHACKQQRVKPGPYYSIQAMLSPRSKTYTGAGGSSTTAILEVVVKGKAMSTGEDWQTSLRISALAQAAKEWSTDEQWIHEHDGTGDDGDTGGTTQVRKDNGPAPSADDIPF